MSKDYEKIGLTVSMAGSFLLSVSAVIMAIIAESQAILLDGLYTFITLLMSFISLKIINLVNLPETKHRPFGYVALEPFLNLIKCLIILMLLATCLITNIQTIINGGRLIVLNLATIYTFICIIIYFVIIWFIKKFSRQTSSSILALEVKNWYIDTLITVGIGISLGAVFIVYQLGYTKILPYIDPVLVIVIVLVSLPVPLKALFFELRNLLLISPENYIEDEVKNQLSHLIDKFHLININIYALKTGRLYQIFIYTDLQNDNTTVTEMDNIRLEITEEITKIYPRNYTDIIFTKIDPNP